MTLEELGYKLIERDGRYYYNGNLNLEGTKITTLPDNLVVGGYLDLRRTKITSLPDNLIVGNSIYLNETDITTLPNNLIVVGFLDLRETNITTLPDNLIVGVGLDLRRTKITSLPNNLIVRGYLDLRETNITTIPNNLKVGGDIYSGGTRITKEEVNKVSHNVPKVLFWRNKEFAIVNYMFYKVISNKGSIYYISGLGDNEVYYLITNSNCSKCIFGDNLEYAKMKYNLLKDEKSNIR